MKPLTDETIANLRELAQHATPGPWSVSPRGGMGYDIEPIEASGRGMVDHYGDACYIAAVSPDVVLALVEEVYRLRAENAMLAEHNEDLARELSDQMDRFNALAEEARRLRELREALTTLEEHMRPAVEHTLTVWVAGPSVRAGVTRKQGGFVVVYDGTIADALIALAREVQT